MEIDKMSFNIVSPIVKCYSSERYKLIIEDSAGVTHYWDDELNYDGYSHDTCKDIQTKTDMN